MPLAEYDENSGFYWITPEIPYSFEGSEEDRAKHEALIKEAMEYREIEAQISVLSESRELNRFLRKYGLVSYRCKRGCLLGSAFNYRGTKYWYSWRQSDYELVLPESPTASGGGVTRSVGRKALFNLENALSDKEGRYGIAECRHYMAVIHSEEIAADMEAVRTVREKTIYLPKA